MKRIFLYNSKRVIPLAYQGEGAGALLAALSYAKTKGCITVEEYKEAVFQFNRSKNDEEAVRLIAEAMPHLTLKITESVRV